MGSSEEWVQKFQQQQQAAQKAHEEQLQIEVMKHTKQPDQPRHPEDIANEEAAKSFGQHLGRKAADITVPSPEAPPINAQGTGGVNAMKQVTGGNNG
jgi:hypothetical protein